MRFPEGDNASGLRKSSRETPMSGQMMSPYPQNVRKSPRLEKELPPSTLQVKRKLERLKNSNTPVRRSDRSKKVLSSSLDFKQAPEPNGPPHSKRKKEKFLSLVTVESEKAELDLEEAVGFKRKKLSGRNFKSLFKKQCKGATSSRLPLCEHHDLLGICGLCSKNKRVGYDSPEQELCFCCYSVNRHPTGFSTCQDRSDHGDAATTKSVEIWNSAHESLEMHEDCRNLCALCNKDGELLFCKGKGCKRSYHHCCLDPAVIDSLPGFWYCPQCVKKKLLFGVHSVSDGVESILDVREVEVSITEGARQLQYLAKYSGLAHIHNHWVPKDQLLLENPCLVTTFIENDQIMKWNVEWRIPQRLLSKRSIQDKIFIASSTDLSVCNYEWLVKWHGLNYDHATWELENEPFLMSSLGQKLMEEYKIRHLSARQEVSKCEGGLAVKLSKLPGSWSQLNNSSLLKNVNKLHEFLLKSRNAVVFDDQDRIATVIVLIQSMKETCRPFLVVTSSSSFPTWEAEFAQMAPSLDVVIYSGTKDTRKGIRASEFYEGYVTLKVLLSSPEAVLEDIDILKSIGWEAIVIDDYPNSGISDNPDQIRVLLAHSNILLFTDQIKDAASDYRRILSLLECHDDFDKLRGVEYESNDNLCKLKDRISRFIAYSSTSSLSKFLEYWVPVQLSNYQLELYCATLLCNATALCSCSRNDSVGVLRNILITVRKCCDHPYLLDLSTQERLIAEKCPVTELLDIGIKVSGKLQILDKMLEEVKTRGLQVLVLFQIIDSGQPSIGDILDDFVRQRFGPTSYERVDAGIVSSKKQAALNRFNKKETGQFVFLLENRAYSSIIKFPSLDVIIVYGSDWNPANDLRALQRISISSKVEQIKVFRLYSSFTVEERALVLAKQKLTFDYNMQNISRTATDTLLSWGPFHLFEKLDDYHADNSSGTALNFSSERSLLLLNEVSKEFQEILSGSLKNNDFNSVISKVQFGFGGYMSTTSTIGETKVLLKDGEESHVFWRNLFDGKSPRWKHLPEDYPRNRKRIHYLDKSSYEAITEKDDVNKKRKKMAAGNSDKEIVQVESGAHHLTQLANSTGVEACNQSENFQKGSMNSEDSPHCFSGANSFGPSAFVGTSEERSIVPDQQDGLHHSLQVELKRLCQTLKLSEDTSSKVGSLLDYVIKNHHVTSDSPSVLHAFQISICWVAASITKQKVHKKDSLICAKKLLNYQCTEEQANLVYTKLQSLKKSYMLCPENNSDSIGDYLLAENLHKESLNINKIKLSKVELENKSRDEKHVGEQITMDDNADGSETGAKIKMVQHEFVKHMDELTLKHTEEIQEFHRMWEEERLKMEKQHKLNAAFVRSIHVQGSILKMRNNLEILEVKFAKKMELHNRQKDLQLKELEAKQLAAVHEERENALYLLRKAEVCPTELRSASGPSSDGSQCEDDVAVPQLSISRSMVGSEDVFSTPGPLLRGQDPSKRLCRQSKDVFTSSSVPVEAIGCKNLYNELGAVSVAESLSPMNGHPNLLENSNYNGKPILKKVSTHIEHHSDEIQPVVQREDFPAEAAKSVPNAIVGHACSLESSNASEAGCGEECDTALPDDLVRLRDGLEAAASVVLQRPGQTSAILEEVPTDVEQHSDEIQPVVHREDFPTEATKSVPNEVVGHTCSVGSSNASEAGSGKECDTAFPDDLVRLRVEPEAANIVLLRPGQTSVCSSPTVATQDCSDSLPQQVQEQISAEPQILDSLAAETRSQMDVLASGLLDDAVSNPSNLEVSLVDGTVVPRSANDEVLLIENMEQLNSKPIDASLSYNPSPATEDADLGRSSSQTVEPGRTDAFSYESCSPSRGNLDMHQSSSAVEVLASDLSDNVISIPSNFQAPVAEGTETPLSSNKGAPVTENSEQLLSVQVNASLSHNTSPATEDPDTGRSSSQTAEPGRTEALSYESCSPSRANLEMHQSSSRIGVLASGLSDNVISIPSNLQAPVDDGTRILLSFNNALITGNSGQLLPVQVNTSLSHNTSPDTEPEQGSILPQTMESGRTEAISCESCSPSRGNLVVPHAQPDVQPACYVTLGKNVEVSSISQSNVAMHQTMMGGVEWPDQAVPPIGIDVSNSRVPISVSSHHHILQTPFQNSAPSLPADPLQNELEKMRKEIADLKMNHENMISVLKSDCEKELQEIVAQIRNKYEVKLEETEAELRLKENELSKNQSKILMNKMLAEALRYKCMDLRPAGPPIQGIPSSFMQQLHQMPLPPSLSQPPVTSACSPASRQQITARPVQSMQQPSGPLSGRSPSSTNCAPPPVQVMQHTAALFSSTSSRPPIISTVTPAEIRSRAPHLQPCRLQAPPVAPATSSSVTLLQPLQMPTSVTDLQQFRMPAPPVTPVTSSVTQLQPLQMPPSMPVQPPKLPPHLTNFASENRPQLPTLSSISGLRPQQMTPCWTFRPPLPPGELPSSINFVSTLPPSTVQTISTDHQPPVPHTRSTFRPFKLSDLVPSNEQGDRMSSMEGLAADFVCLSDDE